MKRWIVDIWKDDEEGWVDYAVSEIKIEDYKDTLLEDRTLFSNEKLAKECALREIEKKYSDLEKYSGDNDIPKNTYRL